MKKKTEYTKEVVYLGEEVGFGSKIRQVFRDKKGEQYSFFGIKGFLFFGESYLMTEGGVMLTRNPPQPEKQTVFATEKERLTYEANKEICKYIRERRKKLMDIKKPHPDIVRAISLLRPFTRDMDFLVLSRFCNYLQQQLSKKEGKK